MRTETAKWYTKVIPRFTVSDIYYVPLLRVQFDVSEILRDAIQPLSERTEAREARKNRAKSDEASDLFIVQKACCSTRLSEAGCSRQI